MRISTTGNVAFSQLWRNSSGPRQLVLPGRVRGRAQGAQYLRAVHPGSMQGQELQVKNVFVGFPGFPGLSNFDVRDGNSANSPNASTPQLMVLSAQFMGTELVTKHESLLVPPAQFFLPDGATPTSVDVILVWFKRRSPTLLCDFPTESRSALITSRAGIFRPPRRSRGTG